MNNYFNKLFVIKSNNLCIILYDGKKNVLYNTINCTIGIRFMFVVMIG